MSDEISNVTRPGTGALRREIIGLLAIKLIALSVLFFVFFGPSARPRITPRVAPSSSRSDPKVSASRRARLVLPTPIGPSTTI